ncbi:MAG TPA: helix-turn-helix transcriptional regulator [Prolixibacteraceae bacterium]|nr:helix-turn-helix transcriptional regulator [Prolixibacteraceae bacterium]
MEVIAWIGFSQALFSGILTLTKGQKSISDQLLSAWLFLLAVEFLTFGVESKVYPNFIFLANSFLLFNPALYLYTCSLADQTFKPKWIQLLHLLPYLFFKISSWIIKEPQSFETYLIQNNTLWYRLLFGICGIISWGVYLWLTGVVLTRHRKQLQNEFSSIDMFKKIGWIMFVVIFYILYCISVFLWGLFNVIVFTTESITIFNYSILLFFIYIFGFYGLKQRDIFPHGTSKSENPVKLQSALLGSENAEKIREKLLTYFEKEKPYLNPDLNMTLLAEKLNIPKHHLTDVLNKNLGKNFFQFVNEYRIEAVKKELSNPKNPYSIEAIGYECGFNSKSTFFSVFKNITEQTPMEYKIQITNSKTQIPKFK